MHADDDLLPLSGLQHLAFCERQCALIHVEQVWEENLFTAEGRVMHENVHSEGLESRGDLRIARALRICSRELGLIGVADVVEFHRIHPEDSPGSSGTGVQLGGVSGRWRPFPVEYKRGKPKGGDCDMVQVCAQAMCLEEMLETSILSGALFYGRPRRRTDVVFDDSLRKRTRELAERLHSLVRSGVTPPAYYEAKCDACSLIEICRPKTISSKRGARSYFDLAIRAHLDGEISEGGPEVL